MSILDDLTGALSSVANLISALGPRPAGDPGGMRDLARAIKAEGETVGTIGTRARGLPKEMVFVGPAATKFTGHAGEVGGVTSAAATRLIALAGDIVKDARRLQDAQDEYDRNRKGLESKLESLAAQVRSAGR